MEEVDLTLKSKDGVEYKISKKNAELSIFISTHISGNDPIEVKEVEGKTLKLIVDFLNHYQGVQPKELEKPLKSTILKEILDDWAYEFVEKLDVEDITNLTIGSNYMEIQSLLDLVCAKVAVMCKDKTDDQIIALFNVKETFTEEEKLKVREENKWIEENL